MTPTRDTDPTPPPLPRSKRDSAGTVARRAAATAIGKLAPYVTALLVTLLATWTARIDSAADTAKKKATETKVEAEAGYGATKEKADATGKVIAELVAELKALREEVERLKAARVTRGRAPKPRTSTDIAMPAVVVEPLPVSPAAAALAKDAAP